MYVSPKNCQVIIGKGICKNKKFLKNLTKFSNNSKCISKLISGASTEQLLVLVEIALNLLKNRIPSIPKTLYKRLSVQASLIRKLSRATSAEKARLLLGKKSVNQKGRGLPAIAALLASSVLPLIVERLSNKFIDK